MPKESRQNKSNACNENEVWEKHYADMLPITLILTVIRWKKKKNVYKSNVFESQEKEKAMDKSEIQF